MPADLILECSDGFYPEFDINTALITLPHFYCYIVKLNAVSSIALYVFLPKYYHANK